VIIRKIRYTLLFLIHKLRSASKYKVHSPYVYKLYTEVILNKGSEKNYQKIEKRRSKLLRQRSLLEITDFGAGASSQQYKTRYRKIKDVTRKSSISPRYGKLLYRIVDFISPEEVLEIGTAMGISTMYIAAAAPKSKITTMEGCAVIADKATESFNMLGLENIQQDLGNFDSLLEKTLRKFDRLDFVFIDGNHREEPTVEYFEKILPKLHSNSFLIIDDIHWSPGMSAAWNKIRKHPEVSISIDLFKLGILMFRKDIAKEHFVLRS